MKWVIVFFMLTGTSQQEFIVDGPGYTSRAKCEQAITKLNLPKEPRPICVQQGVQ
jgi:hypothetical protein